MPPNIEDAEEPHLEQSQVVEEEAGIPIPTLPGNGIVAPAVGYIILRLAPLPLNRVSFIAPPGAGVITVAIAIVEGHGHG